MKILKQHSHVVYVLYCIYIPPSVLSFKPKATRVQRGGLGVGVEWFTKFEIKFFKYFILGRQNGQNVFWLKQMETNWVSLHFLAFEKKSKKTLTPLSYRLQKRFKKKFKATFQNKNLELGSYNNLAQQDMCQTFFSQRSLHPTGCGWGGMCIGWAQWGLIVGMLGLVGLM